MIRLELRKFPCCSVEMGGRDETEAGQDDEFEGSDKQVTQK